MKKTESNSPPIWERNYLLQHERVVGQLMLALLAIYTAVSLPTMIGKTVESQSQQFGLFTQLYRELEITNHLSSVFATAFIFISIGTNFGHLLTKQLEKKFSPERSEELKQKWLPVLSAVLTGIFHWYAESGIVGKEMGTPDGIDAIYGIVSVFVIYVALEYARRQPDSSFQLAKKEED
jgi:hypothetical protein